MTPAMHSRPNRFLARGTSAILLAIGALALVHSLDWRGARFPGFFVMPNRVVPSAALPGWSGVAEGRPLYQNILLAVDGVPIAAAEDGYRRAAAHSAGEPAAYLFARAGGLETRTFATRVLGNGEYVAIFGAYALTALAYLLLATVASERSAEGELYRGLAALGWASAAFGFTGMDLYGPGTLFRLHVFSEALLSAAATHLLLACWDSRFVRRAGVLPLVYGLALALAAVYEFFAYEPGAYSAMHNLSQALAGIPVLVLVARLALAVDRPPPELGRAGLRRMLAGMLVGLVIPAVDDQQDSLVSVRNLLEREGHRVRTAESGEQALVVLKTTEVDLMIVDYVMPRMNGAQLVRAVRAFDPFVQIILQTGYAGEEPPRVMLAELDIQGYHDKADDPERLLLWVDVALKTHRLVKVLRERERAQAELVANCSHEFRTPLNIIAGYAELLLACDFGELPPEAVKPVRSIEEAARSLADLVSDFLRYAKIQAGVESVRQEWVDVGELAREMQRLAEPLVEDRGVDE